MLKRAWLLIAGVWALVFLAAGTTREHGIKSLDVGIAVAPLIAGWLLARGMRFIVTGTAVKPPRAVPYRRL